MSESELDEIREKFKQKMREVANELKDDKFFLAVQGIDFFSLVRTVTGSDRDQFNKILVRLLTDDRFRAGVGLGFVLGMENFLHDLQNRFLDQSNFWVTLNWLGKKVKDAWWRGGVTKFV